MAYIGKSPTGTGVRQRYYFTATGGETSLSGTDDNGLTLVFSDGKYVDVSLNGIALVAGTDYNTSTANTIAGLSALSASDIVEIVVYDIFTVADTVSAKDGGTFSGNVTVNGTMTATSFIGDGSALTGLGGGVSVAVIADQKAANTDGGTATSGAWQTRDLNTELGDPDSIVSISSNQFILGAGDYIIQWSCPAIQTEGHQTRLYNDTAASVVALGQSAFGSASFPIQQNSNGSAYVNLTASANLEIQHRVVNTKATNGFGVGANIDTETYTVVTIFKVG